jgi:hypothetical protein
MRGLVGLLLVLVLLVPVTGRAEAGVAGRYLAGGGSDVRILLTIDHPAPKAFIVLQQIPQGVQTASASPAPSGVQEGRAIRGLFKRPLPGSMLVMLQLSRQVPESQLVGEISYRHPKSGALVTRKISN